MVSGGASEDIQRTARLHFPRLRACYERSHRKMPGAVVVRFAVNADGAVEHALPSAATTLDAAVVECVTREFSTMSFARGSVRTVVYPVHFESADR